MNVAKLNTAYNGGLILDTGSGGGNSGGDNTGANIFAPFIDDGKTRLWVQILQDAEKEIAITYEQESANSLEIDWGDGSPIETNKKTSSYLTHQYKDKGVYCIILSPLGNTTYTVGRSLLQSELFVGSRSSSLGANSIIRADIGSQCVNVAYSFRNSHVRIVNFSPNIQLESIGREAFSDTLCPKFIIPKSVTAFENGSFSNYSASSLRIIDCASLMAVPSLVNTYTLPSMSYSNSYKIIVPDALYDEWIAATNWSAFVDYIVKASEYND